MGAEGTDSEPTFSVTEDGDSRRFELHRDDELVGYADYQERNGQVIVPHVETLHQHRGQGFAARLMEGLLAILKGEGRTIVPLCPFAAQHIADHPEHQELLA